MNHKFKEGDVGFSKISDQFYPFKILRIDVWPDHSVVWHVLNYNPLDREPTENDLNSFSIRAWHAPIDCFEAKAKWIGNSPIREEELKGYFEYLRQTDFIRYLKETGRNVDLIIAEAQNYYKTGCKLADEKKYQEAIDSYDQAINAFPLFYEALDNRGFARMDLGNYKDAISDFSQSLEIEPTGFAAQFSLGECYFRLGDYEKANAEIAKSLTIKDDPMAKGLLAEIQEKIRRQ